VPNANVQKLQQQFILYR